MLITSIEMTTPEVIAKISDGEKWMNARFASDYQVLFETQRFKAERIFLSTIRNILVIFLI